MPPNLLFLLLVSFGITFGLQNDKVPHLTDQMRKIDVLDRMLGCSYCTGFHAGWITWALSALCQGLPVEGWANLSSVLLLALGSAAFSYGVDNLIQAFERHAPRE